MQATQKIPWTTTEILEATGGDLLSGDLDRIFAGISIDSRRITLPEIFIGIKGNTYDGHSFVSDVLDKGVGGLVINGVKFGDLPRPQRMKKGIVCVGVQDTIKALGDLALFHRRRSNASVIAITGSNGKTTTRKMTADVVGQRFVTLSSQGSYNNVIGLPLTLLNLEKCHQWAVLELGMNRPGEIERLSEICVPDVGIITNIGPAHLKGVGSMSGVTSAKGELLKKIKADGTALLNADDWRVMRLAEHILIKVLFFGFSGKADISARSVKEKNQRIDFTLRLPKETVPIHLRTPGRFMVSNALSAAAAGYRLGLSAEEIKAGLENFQPVQGRMNVFRTARGIQIIDDTYNANPDSMKAAMDTLRFLKGKKRGVFVAGDMLELGEFAESMHRMVGTLLAESDTAKLYITGDFAEVVAAGATNEGMETNHIFIGSKKDIVEDLTHFLEPGDWVMVKGSRGMAMEKIVEKLMKWGGTR
jgi:UDP-N-acetylmuramoyl-tripeptide--D-alanyl-D-alanine ligase